MKNINLFLLLVLVLPAIYFSSCSKDDDDFELPSIEYARINMNDTLLLADGGKIILNDSTNVNHKIDTVVIGKLMYVDASFTDVGNGLSSFKVETNLKYKYGGDTSENPEMYKDSIFKVIRLGGDIYGEDTISVYRNWLLEIPDSITRNYRGKLVTLKLEENDYSTKVVCLDIAGNRDSVIFPVRFISRKTIYDAKGIKY